MSRRAIWSNRNFLVLVSGQSLSSLGTAMTNFALPWLLLEVTGSALQMGIGFAIEMLPYLLLSIPAGVWADRYNRKRLMIAVDLIRMLLILSLPVIHLFAKLTVLEIYGVMVLMSACSALFDAAYGAALPVIIGEKSLVEGNALRSTGASTARILGPVLGGSLIAWLGAADTLIVDAVSYLLSTISVAFVQRAFASYGETYKDKHNFLSDAREGIHYLFNHSLIRRLAVLASIINLWGEAVFSVLLYHMRNELHIGSTGSGIIMTAVALDCLGEEAQAIPFYEEACSQGLSEEYEAYARLQL